MTDTAEDPSFEAVVAALAPDIARIPSGRTLTIVEFCASGLTVWEIRPDNIGIPRVRRSWHDWHELRDCGELDERALLRCVRPENDTLVVLARTGDPSPAADLLGRGGVPDQDGPDANRAFALLRAAYADPPTFRLASSVDDVLRAATARVPLPPSVWYELALLRRSRSGRLEFTAQQLFLPEARRGDFRSFSVRCEASDENGTVFAVVARDAASSFELVSLASGKIPPNAYDVTATLLRPGRVRFDGLPVKLRPETRNWLEIVTGVPDRLDVIGPAHLILAIEVCGPADVLDTRFDRASQLRTEVTTRSDGPVTFSLLTYGAHSHERWTADEQVTVHAWMQGDPDVFDRRLRRVRARGQVGPVHPRAAQIECMLAEVARQLNGPDAAAAGRPVLVTIGGRPAFPARLDPVSEIMPCPQRRDWRALFRGLVEAHAGMAFGAIRDTMPAGYSPLDNSADEVWDHLGTDATASPDAFDARRFGAGLGVLSATMQYLPFPLAISEGAD